MKYCQCTLEKTEGSKILKIVSYIPQKYSKINAVVKIKNENGEWENGYVVKAVGEAIEEDLLPDRHEEIKAHRRATGDSLKK